MPKLVGQTDTDMDWNSLPGSAMTLNISNTVIHHRQHKSVDMSNAALGWWLVVFTRLDKEIDRSLGKRLISSVTHEQNVEVLANQSTSARY